VLAVAVALELQRWGVQVGLLEMLTLYLRRFAATLRERRKDSLAATLVSMPDEAGQILLHLIDRDVAAFETPVTRRLIRAGKPSKDLGPGELIPGTSRVTVDLRAVAQRILE
jgi:hypothetical protein